MADGFDVVVRDRVSKGIDTKLDRIASSADKAGAAIARLNKIPGLSNVGGVRGLNDLVRNLNKVNEVSNATARTQGQLAGTMTRFFGAIQSGSGSLLGYVFNMKRAQENSAQLISTMQRGFSTVRAFAGAFLVAGATGSIIHQVDKFRTLQNQIRTTTDSEEQLSEVTRQLFGAADRARVPVGAMAKSYRRFDRAIESAGGSQEESIRLTETVGKLLSINGAEAGEAAASMLQLSQAFNKGKLDGDEFRSVAELMPEVIAEVTKQLGISGAEIFKYSKDGKITLDVLRKAFAELAKQADAEMAALPRTIGQALTQIGNKITQEFGKFDKITGFTNGFVSFIDKLGQNLPTVIKLVQAFAAGFAAFLIPGTIALLGPIGGFFASIGGIIAGATAYLVYFSDQINVSADGVTKLTDVFAAIRQKAVEFFTSLESSGTGAQWAQVIYDRLAQVAQGVFDVATKTVAGVASLFMTLSQYSWSDIGDAIAEALSYPLNELGNWILDLFAKIGDGFDSVIQRITGGSGMKLLMQSQLGLMKTVDAAGGLFGIDLDKDIKQMETLMKLSKDTKIGIGDIFRDLKQESATPVLSSMFDSFLKNQETTLSIARSGWVKFYDDLMVLARQKADERMAIERQIRQDEIANPGALRGVDAEQQERMRQTQEVLRFQEALKEAEKTTWKAKMAMDDRRGDGFRVQMAQAALANEKFSETTIRAGLGLDTQSSKMQSAASAAGSYSNTVSQLPNNINQVSQGATNVGNSIQEAGNKSQSFFSDMSAGFTGLLDQISQFQQQVSEGLGEIFQGFGSSFKDGKWDWKSFLSQALPGAAKMLLGKYNENYSQAQLGATAQGAPNGMGGGFFDIGPAAQAAQAPVQSLNSALQQTTAQLQQQASTQSPISQLAAPQGDGFSTQTASLTQMQSLLTAIVPQLQEVQTTITTIRFDQPLQSLQSFITTASTGFQSVGQAGTTSATQIQTAYTSAMQAAGQAVSQFSSQAIADLQAVADAASSVSVGGGGGGGNPFFGFASGGYTGNGNASSVAGIVHKREFVVPEGPAQQYRPILEAMRSGKSFRSVGKSSGGVLGGGGNVNIKINNNANATVQARQLSSGEIEVMINDRIAKAAPRIVASQIGNPNSQISKSLATNTKTQRSRR